MSGAMQTTHEVSDKVCLKINWQAASIIIFCSDTDSKVSFYELSLLWTVRNVRRDLNTVTLNAVYVQEPIFLTTVQQRAQGVVGQG